MTKKFEGTLCAQSVIHPPVSQCKKCPEMEAQSDDDKECAGRLHWDLVYHYSRVPDHMVYPIGEGQ